MNAAGRDNFSAANRIANYNTWLPYAMHAKRCLGVWYFRTYARTEHIRVQLEHVSREATESHLRWWRSRERRVRTWTGIPQGMPEFDPVTILEECPAHWKHVQQLQPLEKIFPLWRFRQAIPLNNLEGPLQRGARRVAPSRVQSLIELGATLRIARGQLT